MDKWTEVLPVGDVLVRGAALYPEREAVVFPTERRTYRELLEGAQHVLRGLWALGVRPGDHVGILMPNCAAFLEAYFATALLGAVATPINARYRRTELQYIIENADLVTVLTTDVIDEHVDFGEILHASLPSLSKQGAGSAADRLELPEAPRLRNIALMHGGENKAGFIGRQAFNQLASSVDPAVVAELRHRVRLRDLATIVYTSGTTSNPKGCMLSHEAVVRTSIARAVERFSRKGIERLWCPGPFFHMGALAPMLGSLALGDTFLTMMHFDPTEALAMIEREQVTRLWPLFHPIIQRLMDDPAFASTDLSRVTGFACSGSPETVRRMQRAFPGARVVGAYGMTETCAVIVVPVIEDKTDSALECGKPYRGIEIDIVDPASGVECSPGELGEIWVRGYCCMEGYYRDPQKTAETIDPDGWLHTGDLGLLTQDGSLVFRGRLRDVLKVGGESVSAVEVESFLHTHPAIRHSEVVGMRDPRLEEVAVAFVELYAGATLSEEEVIGFCRQEIASYKVPRRVWFINLDEWPMSATKVDKVALRQRVIIETQQGEGIWRGYEQTVGPAPQ